MEETNDCDKPVASQKNKTPMTDQERLKLADKLDKELDEFINGLEKRQYTEGWPEDKWEEEMDKHPFFMKKLPEPGAELHPLYEGLQKLKYDPEENTAEELAVAYKEDGNFNFKHKKYRMAIIAYTEGIKQKHNNNELKATLYNNRAASNFFLKNYRSCLRDCEIALRLKPKYTKVLLRAAQCCFEILQWDKCITYCDEVLLISPTDNTTLILRQKAVNTRKEEERNKRRRNREQLARRKATEKLFNEIQKRNITLADVKSLKEYIDDENALDNKYNILKPVVPQLEDSQVFLDEETGQLVWPVVLVYPEFGVMDFIKEFYEQEILYNQFNEIFQNPAEWDQEHKYTVDKLSVYYEEKHKNGSVKLHKISLDSTLLKVMTSDGFVVENGTPQFIILERGSNKENHFIQQYK